MPKAERDLSPKEFGRLIRRLRKARGLGLREVARQMRLSPGFYGHAELGERDLRKPEYVDTLAAILGADVADLRRAAGLESHDVEGMWFFEVQHIASTFLGAHARGTEKRLYRALGWLLQWVWFNAQEAWDGGRLNEEGIAKLEAMVRAMVTIVERKHPGATSPMFQGEPKPGAEGLYAAADAVFAQVERLHEDQVERLLKYEPST